MSNLITIVNNTEQRIDVRVTADGESGSPQFYDIMPHTFSSWKRDQWQMCFVLRVDNGKTENFVAKPGVTYVVQ